MTLRDSRPEKRSTCHELGNFDDEGESELPP